MTMTIKWSSVRGNEYSKWNWSAGIDLEEDERFLNEMIAQGFTPVRISGGGSRFTFVACQPGEYICRAIIAVTSNGFFDKKKVANLEALLIDEGAHVIPQINTLGSQIGIFVVRAAVLGTFEINSDLDSRIAEYQARQKYHGGMGAMWLCIGATFMAALVGPENNAWSSAGVIWFILGLYCLWPSFKYGKIIKRLKAERDVSEI
jgi:hypothetical protein